MFGTPQSAAQLARTVDLDPGCCLRAPAVPAPPAFRASLGERPPFCSQRDADAYDGGYRDYDNRHRTPVPHLGTPRRRGWDDAQAEQHRRNAENANKGAN